MALVVLNAGLLFALPTLRYRSLVIHHTAGPTGDLASIRKLHDKYGLDAAYHLILSNGSGGAPRGHLESTRWYALTLSSPATSNRRCNLSSVQLCIVGNYESAPLPADLQVALGHAVAKLQRTYGIPDERVRLHRDCNATKCPGRHVTWERVLEWKQAAANCPADVARQQDRVIDGPLLGSGPFSWTWLTAALSGSTLIVLWPRRRSKRRRRR